MSILSNHYYLFLGSMLLFLSAHVSGKVVFLHGTACAGKTSLCNAMVKQRDEWKMVSDDDIFIERAALRWKTEFPTEFCAVEAAIDTKNIFHAVMRNQILFRADASLQERLNAQNAMIAIRQELNSRPKSDPADPHSWSNLLRNQITQIIIDQAEQAHVIVESWFLKEEHIAQIAEKYEVIHVAAYCTFSDMIKRVMKRNYDALMLGKDISSLRFFHQALTSFTSLYYLSDNPENAIDLLSKKDVIHALDLVRACLHDSPDSTGASQTFTRGEISLAEFEEYQHTLLSCFTSDTAYVIPKFKVDEVIRTDHKSATQAAQLLLQDTQSEIITVSSIEDATHLIKSNAKNSLVLIDIDDTLFIPADKVMRNFNIAHYKQFMNSFKDHSDAFLLKTAVFQSAQYKLLEKEFVPLIEELKNVSLGVFGFTARHTGLFIQDTCVEEWTAKKLADLGIVFSSGDIAWEAFKGGIIFCSVAPKGDVLKEFLERISFSPETIIMIDDRLENIHNVFHSIKEWNKAHRQAIRFLGFHYTAAELLDHAIDEEVVKKQLDTLIKEKVYLSEYAIKQGKKRSIVR